MHVMMNAINKLLVGLKQSWIEHSVQIEPRSGPRARFINLSEFLKEKSQIANSIFGRETFPEKVNFVEKKLMLFSDPI